MATNLSNTYVVHCADTVCSMGLRESKIVLRKTHGVFMKDLAQMTIKDQKSENIICFGGCYSAENPSTIETAEKMAAEVKESTGESFEDQVVDIFTVEGEGGSKVMECVGECIPVIVSTQWDNEKEDVSVEPGKNALLGEAILTCKYGGIIKIITTGQPEVT